MGLFFAGTTLYSPLCVGALIRKHFFKSINNIWGYLQVVNPFLPSFTFDVDTAKGELRKNSGLTHRYLWLAYKQYNNERVR